MNSKKRAVIIGAGPAGLTAAYELLKESEYEVVILEETDSIGGISQTINHNGNRMDIGGHRFFSKNQMIMDWWTSILPVQGFASRDDLVLNRVKPLAPGGPNPESIDRVMLIRDRVSRIFYLQKFFDYPISLKAVTFLNMGFARTFRAGISYVYSAVFKREERTLEDFMINRFGKALYGMFFENYTEKVWGVHPSNISADWGAQRIKGLSLLKVISDFFKKIFKKNDGLNQNQVETSLIEQFIYPKFGPGQLWETAALEVKAKNGEILKGCKVIGVNAEGNNIRSVTYEKNGEKYEIKGDVFISSMPVKELVEDLSGIDVPEDIHYIASNLPYRDFITVGILVNKLKIKNKTKIKSMGEIVPDCWIYIQEPEVKVGRLQIFNNWSPYMVKDMENTVWIGLEYFCNEGDGLWNMSDGDFINFSVSELRKIGILNASDILDSVRVKVKKAYPAYFGTYKDFDIVREFLDKFANLYCIGRNGQHRYNNMDHSMLTAMEAVRNIISGRTDKKNIWSVNTEEEYHESQKKTQ